MDSEAIKRDAYPKGVKLKSSGLDEETILIRLEKQGVAYDLAKEVAKNVVLQRKIDKVNNEQVHPFGEGFKEWAIAGLFAEMINFFKKDKR